MKMLHGKKYINEETIMILSVNIVSGNWFSLKYDYSSLENFKYQQLLFDNYDLLYSRNYGVASIMF